LLPSSATALLEVLPLVTGGGNTHRRPRSRGRASDVQTTGENPNALPSGLSGGLGSGRIGPFPGVLEVWCNRNRSGGSRLSLGAKNSPQELSQGAPGRRLTQGTHEEAGCELAVASGIGLTALEIGLVSRLEIRVQLGDLSRIHYRSR
jgi:hypothetical protein